MTGYPLAVGLTLAVVAFVLVLLRTRRLREKYASIWIVLAVVVAVLAAFPDLAIWMAGLLGVVSPANLLFSCALVVLLGVCIQLSSEVSTLEEETRTVAEELALLADQVAQLEQAVAAAGSGATPPDEADAGPGADVPVDADVPGGGVNGAAAGAAGSGADVLREPRPGTGDAAAHRSARG